MTEGSMTGERAAETPAEASPPGAAIGGGADPPAADADPAAAGDGGLAALRRELREARAALDAERSARRADAARYREALLAAEPGLPPELVEGDGVDALDASAEAARRTVARIRERLAGAREESAGRGFPAGAPGRGGPRTEGMTAGEKIAYGLERLDRR